MIYCLIWSEFCKFTAQLKFQIRVSFELLLFITQNLCINAIEIEKKEYIQSVLKRHASLFSDRNESWLTQFVEKLFKKSPRFQLRFEKYTKGYCNFGVRQWWRSHIFLHRKIAPKIQKCRLKVGELSILKLGPETSCTGVL